MYTERSQPTLTTEHQLQQKGLNLPALPGSIGRNAAKSQMQSAKLQYMYPDEAFKG